MYALNTKIEDTVVLKVLYATSALNWNGVH
jgi:hypothetical protein